MRRWLGVVVGAAVAGLVAALLLTNRGGPGIPVWMGICTNNAGVARTWTNADSGLFSLFQGSGSASASASASDSKNAPQAAPLAVKPQEPVLDAIAHGVDPVDAARLFGTIFLPGNISAAERAAAQDPATYGWRCAR
jgi:hypothetical protein